MNEMEKYLYNHGYVSEVKKCNRQFELSKARAECIANKYNSLVEEKDKEIERLNNIIDNIDKNIDIFIDERIETNKGMIFLKGGYESSMNYLRVRLHDKLKELKGDDKDENN